MRRGSRQSGPIQFNMTPMIDVTFLLIIFFMLASQFVSAEHADLKLPDPENSQAREVKVPQKVTINVQISPEGDPRILVGPIPCANLDELFARLQRQKAESGDLQVVLRADRRVKYAFVRDVMRTVADSGIELMNLAARRDPD
jgi:biopolymer transport protein ExbD